MIMQCECYKVYQGYIEFNSKQRKKRRKTKKTSVPKESVENADLCKLVLNKIITSHE